MRRVFLDIGAHTGETLGEVLKPVYGFDRIFAFEPASVCLSELGKFDADPRVEICPVGLSARTEKLELHDPGSLGASVLSKTGPTETIQVVDAAKWFRDNLAPDDFLVVKTNCEGAEVDIINRLLDEQLFSRAVIFLITFDVREFPEHRHKEVELRRRLKQTGLTNFCFSDDVMIGTTHGKRIAHWLGLFGIDKALDRAEIERRYGNALRHYASRTGRRERFETVFKERFRYSALPEPAKRALRFVKHALKLDRERDV